MRSSFPSPKGSGSVRWHITADAPGQLAAHVATARGWAGWIDARGPLAHEWRERHGEDVEPPGPTPPRPDVHWSPVPLAELAAAVAFLAPVYSAGEEPATYRRVHVGPAGELGITDGSRAHVTPPVAPFLPVGASLHWSALEWTIRAARAAGATVVGLGIDPAGAVLTRAVGPALDVVTRTDTAPPVVELWRVVADEAAAAAGLCARVLIDTPAHRAALLAAIGTTTDGRLWLRVDADGMWTCAPNWEGGTEAATPWPGQLGLEAERDTTRPTQMALPAAQLAGALSAPLPLAVVVRDEWTPTRVESAAGHRALIMPWRTGA